MKRKLFVIFSFVLLSSLVFIACNKDDQDGLTVGFADQQGTGNNPDNTSSATNGGATTSTTVGSTSTTGSTSLTSGSTTSTTATTSSTSSTSGSTTTPPVGNWFKMNSTLYNCTSVTGGPYNNSWSVIGRSAAGDTSVVSFLAIPNAGTYTVVFGIPSVQSECTVVSTTSTSTIVGMDGTVTVSLVGTKRKVVFNLTDCVDQAMNPAATSGNMTEQ
ncbi:MAG TPA: hypothetical protein VGF30_10590 [Bacteroidia bacterium]